jgi:hypothetical protein
MKSRDHEALETKLRELVSDANHRTGTTCSDASGWRYAPLSGVRRKRPS